MTIGILIPTRNRRDYLAQALKSACAQTHPDIKIIVIDNCSTDGTADFMAALSDPRVRYVVNDRNIGMINSINKGIGLFPPDVKWCTILTDDDLLHPDFARSMHRMVTEDSSRLVIQSRRKFINVNGRVISEASQPPRVETARDYIHCRSRFRRESYLCGVFFLRAAFEEIGGYPLFTTGTATDDAFIFALALRNGVHFNKEALAYIRIHSEAESLRVDNVARHFQAFDDFSLFVRQKAEQSGKFSDAEVTAIDAWVREYVTRSNSSLWIASMRRQVKSGEDNSRSGIIKLYRLAAGGYYPFTRRVGLSVFCLKKFRKCPEAHLPYWLLWELCDTFRKGLFRKFRILIINRAARA